MGGDILSSFVGHLVIPTLAVMATGMFPRKKVLQWMPFTFVSDLDFIFNFFGYYILGTDLLLHRAIFHNIFIGLPTLIIAVVLWRRMLARDPELHWASFRDKWAAFGNVPYGYGMVLATVFLESHVFLDMFQGGVTPLWPFLNLYVYPRFIIWINTQTGLPTKPTAEVQTGTGAPALSPLYPWLTPEDLAFLVLAVGGLVFAFWYESRRASRAKVPEADAAPEDTDG